MIYEGKTIPGKNVLGSDHATNNIMTNDAPQRAEVLQPSIRRFAHAAQQRGQHGTPHNGFPAKVVRLREHFRCQQAAQFAHLIAKRLRGFAVGNLTVCSGQGLRQSGKK